uniref:Chemokine interleukin-8-like domain-containing protein n=1 Tax=Pygocentrus nattereri TaxID=42514 RepID=A0A3B4ENW7_PYGNA
MKTSVAVMRSLATVAIVRLLAENVRRPCCVSVSRSRVVEPLKAYRLQDRNPPCVKAVIFETENEHYCLDASQPWVQEKIDELIRRQKTTVSPTSVSPHLTFSAPEKTSQKKDEPSINYYCYTTAHQP